MTASELSNAFCTIFFDNFLYSRDGKIYIIGVEYFYFGGKIMFYYKFINAIETEPLSKVWKDEESKVIAFDFSHNYISKRIIPERVAQWSAQTPVFISAQTGAGKSTLILDELLPIMKEREKRIVILCSRTVLAEQLKRNVAGRELPDIHPELLEAMVKYGNRSQWGAVDVFTYQEIAMRMHDAEFCKKFKFYGAVVLDEVHFFVEDAVFNVHTSSILDFVMDHSKRAVRVYLTATPESVADLVIEEEMKRISQYSGSKYFQHGVPVKRVLFYNFRRDYSYVKPHFFHAWDTLIDEINLKESDERWLIFVAKKDEGKLLAEKFGEERALFVDAELKNGALAEEIASMTENNKFIPQILIVTKFLDVGVDLWDSKLKNVVISTFSKTNFIQSLGRKRIKKGEEVNLYVRIPSIDELQNSIKGSGYRLSMFYKGKEMMADKNRVITDIPAPFFLVNGTMKFNTLYEHATLEARRTTERLLSASFNNTGNPSKALAIEYLSWIEIDDAYDESQWIGMPPTDAQTLIQEFIQPWYNIELSKDEFEQFKDTFTKFVKTKFPGQFPIRPGRPMGTNRTREFFNLLGIPYDIKNPMKGIHKISRR